MYLGHIELFVSDPLESFAFYHEVLGFDLVDNQSDTFIWVESEGMEILLRPAEEGSVRQDFGRHPVALVLYTEDLEGSIEHLQQFGVEIIGNDQGSALFTDPDGNWIQMINPDEM